jgi:hypothetical protein
MKLTSLAAAGAIALLAAGASYAQQPPAGPAPVHGGVRAHPRPDPAQMAERHAQHLRDALQLRPDQEPALRALVDATRRPAGAMKHERGVRQAALPTPERLDRMRARLVERQARFDEHATAIKRFYAQLTPSQQRAFDAMGPMGGGRHGKHGGHERSRG